jgi:aminoglycoside 6'-N-acetyltransferase
MVTLAPLRSCLVPDVTLRLMRHDDLPSFSRWVGTPHVARWWREPPDLSVLTADYGNDIAGRTSNRVFVIEVDGKAVGMIQVYPHVDDPDWDEDIGVLRAAGIDYIIGDTNWIGKGIGPRAIELAVTDAFERLDVDVVVGVPQRDNVPSCRALEKAGFHLLEERKLRSAEPSDAGISRIYVRPSSGNVTK